MNQTSKQLSRRTLVKSLGAGTLISGLPAWAHAGELLPSNGYRVVIVGGGFGGSIVAKTLRQNDPSLEIVLIERNEIYTACPTTCLVLAGVRKIEENQFTYKNLQSKYGIKVILGEVIAVDTSKKSLTLNNGTLKYDKLVLSPGIDFRFSDIQAYDPINTAITMPHAWKAGEQTLLLRKKLEAMPDGGTVLISIPEAPYRCPSAPYERACLIALYLKNNKPKSRIIILDANKGIVSKAAAFRAVWKKSYEGLIDYRSGHKVVRVSPDNMTVYTADAEFKADVINLIPPQQAGQVAHLAGVVGDDKRWCPVNQVSYESSIVKDVYVIGDACIAGPMAKSGYTANSQAKVCALNMLATIKNKTPWTPSLANILYSFTSDKEAVSIATVYRVTDGKTEAISGSGGVSNAPSENEGAYALAWFRNIVDEMSN